MGNRPPRHRRTGKTPERAISARHEHWYRQHMAGVRHQDIADEAGVTREAVSKAVVRVEQIMAGEFIAEIGKYRNRCTMRLEHLYAEAVREWERSKLPQTTDKIGQRTDGPDGEFDEETESYFIERTTKSQTGSPQLHAAARNTLKDLMELHGIRYVETQADTDEDDDIAGLTTAEQVEREIRNKEGDIKRLQEYRALVQQMEGGAGDTTDADAAVAAEREQVLETPDEGSTEGPAPDQC